MWNSDQLMNFCDHVFKTNVTSDTVCCEGYDVTNLLSDDVRKRSCGFLSDRFIKPPVEVTLKFPFEISISHIQIVTEVGQQKSNAVEISSSFVTSKRDNVKDSGLCIVEKVGYANIENSERGVIFFCPQLHGRHWTHPEANKMKMRAFSWIQRSAIIHTSKLSIRILRTSGSSIPGIGSIEVWGVPSPRLSKSVIDEIKKLWNSSKEPQGSSQIQVPMKEQDMKVKITSIDDADMLDPVPEDFLDAITHEVMALPMVLPSGKIVDQRTLERHAAEEALWGRPPSDPFTGITFKRGCQPVLDVALKGRLDRFLVLNQNTEHLRMVPRTLGRMCTSQKVNHCASALGISSLIDSNKRIGVKRVVARESNPVGGPFMFSSISSKVSETVTKAEAASRDIEISPAKKAKYDDCEVQYLSGPLEIGDNSSRVGSIVSYEDKLDRSLDFAIKAALSGLPSFVNPVIPKQVIRNCSSCKDTKTLFSLPCDHYLCRSCLVGVTRRANVACPSCSIIFKSSDPVRCHD